MLNPGFDDQVGDGLAACDGYLTPVPGHAGICRGHGAPPNRRRDKFRDFFRDSERLFRGFGGDGENLSVEEAVNHAARRSGAHCNRAERIANALPENFPQLGDTFQVLFQVEERGKGERSSP